MDINDQSDAFTFDLDNLVSRYQNEFDLNSFTLAGILELKKLDILLTDDIEFDMDDEFWDTDSWEDG